MVTRAGRIAAALALGLSLVAAPGSLRAEDRAALLDAPAPPTLPALAHPGLNYTFEYTAAAIAPSEEGSTGARAFAWFAHNEVELPVESRKWYIGAAHDIAAGAVPGLGKNLFLGNPEIWGRGLWSSVVGLSTGGGLGVVLPLPRSPSEDEVRVLHTVRVVRPWDSAYFLDRTVTLRPFIDIRHVVGRFLFQIRQGVDIDYVIRPLRITETPVIVPGAVLSSLSSEHRLDFVARATVYAGVRATREVGLGLEVWEVYQITAEIPDDKRASVAVSPSVRLMLGRVAPAFSVLLPITTPLRGEAASYYAARLNVSFDFDLGKASSLALGLP
ncbi:MAG: hypothetical protein U0359_23425 [Byssovorax sp.]